MPTFTLSWRGAYTQDAKSVMSQWTPALLESELGESIQLSARLTSKVGHGVQYNGALPIFGTSCVSPQMLQHNATYCSKTGEHIFPAINPLQTVFLLNYI
jgi:hypothetical protein